MRKDPDVAGVVSVVGVGTLNTDAQRRRSLKIMLKPRNERNRLSPRSSSA